MSEQYIGPALPPHLMNTVSQTNVDDDASESNMSEQAGKSSPNDTYGPALPPHLQKSVSDNCIKDEDVDVGAYGPLPIGISGTRAHEALEERALQLKLGYLDSDKEEVKVREEWMLELPQVGVSKLGLSSRQFRKNAGPDFSDRSSWTDTPETKKLNKSKDKVDLKKETRLKEIYEHDKNQAEIAKNYNHKGKRDKSLLEIHADNLKKRKLEEAEAGVPTRRPFNRDIDLKVNQFDEAQKKSILKKAMHLDDRFSSGQSKFL